MERWKACPGHEGYEVSDHGRVRSVDRERYYDRLCPHRHRIITVRLRHRGRILRQYAGDNPHPTVPLGRGGKHFVHHLVLEAFVGPRPEGKDGLHWDDDPLNNRPSNLRWGTHSDNAHDAVRNGRRALGSAHHCSKLAEADIHLIRRRLAAEGPAALAREYAVDESTIRQVEAARAWKHVPAPVGEAAPIARRRRQCVDKAAALRLYREGATLEAIAAQMGVTAQRIDQIAREAGEPCRSRPRQAKSIYAAAADLRRDVDMADPDLLTEMDEHFNARFAVLEDEGAR